MSQERSVIRILREDHLRIDIVWSLLVISEGDFSVAGGGLANSPLAQRPDYYQWLGLPTLGCERSVDLGDGVCEDPQQGYNDKESILQRGSDLGHWEINSNSGGFPVSRLRLATLTSNLLTILKGASETMSLA